jgi:hypothetical protein
LALPASTETGQGRQLIDEARRAETSLSKRSKQTAVITIEISEHPIRVL